jgi:peptidoglycan/xylan/chitin deacetylase (PgdA/CDA1 family)
MKYKVNISIDDVSPHPRAGIGVLDRCDELISEFPDIKFTLFVPICYSRLGEPQYPIGKFPEFCQTLKKLPTKNFEIGYHGYHHGIIGKNSNDEFRYLNYDDALDKFKFIIAEVGEAGMNGVFKSIFRPPAWRMTPDAIRAAKDVGVEVLALSPDKYDDGSLDYKGEDTKFGNVVYYNVCPPFKPLQLFEKTEMVYHACEWDKNYLNKKQTSSLKEFLHENIEDIKFSFIGDLNGEN